MGNLIEFSFSPFRVVVILHSIWLSPNFHIILHEGRILTWRKNPDMGDLPTIPMLWEEQAKIRVFRRLEGKYK
jgi:hypothetical protein